MFTVYRKGQGTVGEIFIFYAIIFVNIFLFFLLIAGGGTFTKEVDPAIQYELGDVRAESTITSTTNDYVWRSEEVEPGKYEFKQTNELLSIYFSTPGDTIYIGEREIPKSELKSDLQNYLKYKMDKYYVQGPGSTPYWLEITHESGNELSVNTENYQPRSSDQKINVPLALTGGENAVGSLWYRYEDDTSTGEPRVERYDPDSDSTEDDRQTARGSQ